MTYQAAAEMRRDGFSETDIAEAIAYMNQKWEVRALRAKVGIGSKPRRTTPVTGHGWPLPNRRRNWKIWSQAGNQR